MRHITALVLATALLCCAPACADFYSTLHTVTAGAVKIGNIIDEIERVLDQKGVHDARVDTALRSVRGLVNATIDAAHGAESIHDRDLLATLDRFQAAWEELQAALAPYNIKPSLDGVRFAATADGGTAIPDPPHARLMLEGQL